MKQTKVMYCHKCGRKTVHNLVDVERDFEGFGPFRILVAIMSLGISEKPDYASYQCERCGKIKEEEVF